jgi:transcription-repair coupling factor (superfamily II helicase)
MSEAELDRAMGRFLDREADVLVSTSIIESGLDIPSVNTIFIDRADRFGVADLHQLRGRVGRARVRAYCYLLVPPDEAVATEGLARVKALEEFSDLGAGWRLAMRDLELRGAGNLLGMEQSGHIAEVGYDLYARMLARSSKELRGEPVPEEWEVSVSLARAALLPEGLLPSPGERLEFYRRLAGCESDEEVRALGGELADRCGRLPEEARRMLREAELRVRARAARAAFVGRDGRRLAVKFFGRPAREAAHALSGKFDPRFPDESTLTLALPAGAEDGGGEAILEFAREVLDALRVPAEKPPARGRRR